MHSSTLTRVLVPVLAVALLAIVPPRAAADSSVAVRYDKSPARGEVVPGVMAGEDAPAAGRPADDPDLLAGWPVNLFSPGAGFPYTPTLYDADDDGADEIFLTGGHTFGLRGDGSFLPGWPTTEMQYMGYGTNANKPGPSAADLDNDLDSEILWSERDWWAGSARMWSFNGKNLDGSDLPGFPQQAIGEPSNALDTPFVLGDTDGDGDLEAWGAHTLGNNFVHYRISAFDHLGTRLFTVDLDTSENVVSLYFGDLDGDGSREMFAISWLSPDYWLHVFEPDGSEQAGYPIIVHTFVSGTPPFGPPVPADLDRDGDLEILIGRWDGGGSRAYCHHHDGSPCAGFPIQIATSSQLFYLGLGDVTGDGDPELIAFDNHLGGNHRVHVIDLPSGTALPGWPYPVLGWPKGFPTVVDVDNDALQDVCLATDTGELLAVSGQGQLIAGYPKMMVNASISGVAAGDIDGDGLFELVAATWDGWVYAWDTPGQVLPGRADWPLRGVDARNTGVFAGSGGTTAIGLDPAPARFSLSVHPNPIFTSGEFVLEPASLTGAALEIYDPSGRLVKVLDVGGKERPVWRPGRAHPSGVYFARLRAEGLGSSTLRFSVLR